MKSMMPKRFWEGEFANFALLFCGKSCTGVTRDGRNVLICSYDVKNAISSDIDGAVLLFQD